MEKQKPNKGKNRKVVSLLTHKAEASKQASSNPTAIERKKKQSREQNNKNFRTFVNQYLVTSPFPSNFHPTLNHQPPKLIPINNPQTPPRIQQHAPSPPKRRLLPRQQIIRRTRRAAPPPRTASIPRPRTTHNHNPEPQGRTQAKGKGGPGPKFFFFSM